MRKFDKSEIFGVIASMSIYLVITLITVGLVVGEILCMYKFVTCDFKPSYKEEIVYGIGMVTGTGGIIGWLDLKEESK